MSFFKNFAGIAATAIVLCACSGGGDATPPSENSNANQRVTQTSEPTPTPAAPAPTAPNAEPSPEFASLPAPYIDGDYARGRRVFRQCSSCHTIAEGGAELIGPNLHGLFSRKVGTVEGFPYSNALQEADFDWTPEMLAQWLESPRNFLPDNRMSFGGVRKPADRTAVIAYIMLESGWSAAAE